MSDSQPTSGDSPRLEPTFEGHPSAPSIRRASSCCPSRSPIGSPRAGLSKAVVWASAFAAGLALIAGVAAASLYDHAHETSLLAARSEETAALPRRSRRERSHRRNRSGAGPRRERRHAKIAIEMKGESAGAHAAPRYLGYTNARIDKLERDHGARLDKLADRFDH